MISTSTLASKQIVRVSIKVRDSPGARETMGRLSFMRSVTDVVLKASQVGGKAFNVCAPAGHNKRKMRVGMQSAAGMLPPQVGGRSQRSDRRHAARGQLPLRLAAVASIFLATLLPRPAYACQCGGVPSVAEAIKSAKLVFEGTVVERWPVLIRMPVHEMPTERYTVRVLRSWKGAPRNSIYLVDTGGNCSYPFEVGYSYLVFASSTESSPYYSSTICDPTELTATAAEKLRELGPGTVVQSSFTLHPESSGHRLGRRATAAILMAVTLLCISLVRLFETQLGVWLAFILTLAFSAVGYIGLRSLVRGRWRWSFVALVLAAMLTLSAAALLGCGYWYATTHPGFRHLIE